MLLTLDVVAHLRWSILYITTNVAWHILDILSILADVLAGTVGIVLYQA